MALLWVEVGARRGACGALAASHDGALAVVGLDAVLVGPSALAPRGAWACVPVRAHARPPHPLPVFEAAAWAGWGATPAALRATAPPHVTAVAWAPAPWALLAVATSDGRCGVHAAHGSQDARAAAAAAGAPPPAAAAATEAAAEWPMVMDVGAALAARAVAAAGARAGATALWPLLDVRVLVWVRGAAAHRDMHSPVAAGSAPPLPGGSLPPLIIGNAAGELLCVRGGGVPVWLHTLPEGDAASALAASPWPGREVIALGTAMGAVTLWAVEHGGGGELALTPLACLRRAGALGGAPVDAAAWSTGSAALGCARLATVECGTLSVWGLVVPDVAAADTVGGGGGDSDGASECVRGDHGLVLRAVWPARGGGARATCAGVIGAHEGHSIAGVAWAPGERVFTVGDDGFVRTWDARGVQPAAAGAHSGVNCRTAALAAAVALAASATMVRASPHAVRGVVAGGAGRLAHVAVSLDSDGRVSAAATALHLR